ncbi:MAG: hypothetical protein PUD20_04030 [bacterium]|nr:hypothetical protein [bacterium]
MRILIQIKTDRLRFGQFFVMASANQDGIPGSFHVSVAMHPKNAAGGRFCDFWEK